jgi:DNA mismatch repair ATPase MutS
MVHSADFYQLYQTTYENYTELYGKHVCVFLQKGSFYELYGIYDPEKDCYENTVKEVADLLDLQLKVYPKDVKNTKTGLFGGVPEHTIHKWAGKLCNLGWTCILIDQVKNSIGEITKREVTRVLSPGTHLEQAHSDESMYVLSIYISVMNLSSPPKVGICAIECSTAQVIHYEQEATGTLQSWHADSSAQFVSTFYPKEVILNWNGGSIFCPEEQDLRIIFEIPQTVPIYINMTDSSIQSSTSTSRGEYISSYIRNESMLDIRSLCGLVNSSQAEYAMYELFMFIEKHDRAIIEMIQIPEKWNPENMMAVLNHAMDQLNDADAMFRATENFCRMLQTLRLLVPINLPNVNGNLGAGLEDCYRVDERALDSLSDAALCVLRKEGWLAPLYAHRISLSQFDVMPELEFTHQLSQPVFHQSRGVYA